MGSKQDRLPLCYQGPSCPAGKTGCDHSAITPRLAYMGRVTRFRGSRCFTLLTTNAINDAQEAGSGLGAAPASVGLWLSPCAPSPELSTLAQATTTRPPPLRQHPSSALRVCSCWPWPPVTKQQAGLSKCQSVHAAPVINPPQSSPCSWEKTQVFARPHKASSDVSATPPPSALSFLPSLSPECTKLPPTPGS